MTGNSYSLQPYLGTGVLRAGADLLSVEVAGQEVTADLGRNGEIFFEGVVFGSPTAFSLYVRRKINPSRRVDDGWSSVKFDGNVLDSYRCCLGSTNESKEKKIPSKPGSPATRGKRSRKARSAMMIRPSNVPGDDPVSAEALGSNEPENTQAKAALAMGASDRAADLTAKEHQEYRAWEREQTESLDLQEPRNITLEQWHPGDETWVSCDNCQKWRRIRASLISDNAWYCADNPDRRFASCDVLQELSDDAIDKLLEEEHFHTYVQSSSRGLLDTCDAHLFETDLIAFLEQLGEETKAEQLRSKRIQCNNRPLDIFGLYREVIQVGGFISNEAYDETGRWIGRINFAGHVFPKMLNFTKDHRATSVGNQLLTNYRKYLYDYERAWRHLDMPKCSQTNNGFAASIPRRIRRAAGPRTKGGTSALPRHSTLVSPVKKGNLRVGRRTRPHASAKHKHSPISDARNEAEEGLEATTPDSAPKNSAGRDGSEGSDKGREQSGGSTGLSGSSNRRCGALLMLAGIVSDQNQGAADHQPSTHLQTGGPCRTNRGPWQSKRRKMQHIDSSLLAAATNSSDLTQWWRTGESPCAGELLCLQETSNPGMLWPVLVAGSDDLPGAILEGQASESAQSLGFPYDAKELTNCNGPIIPVLAFGSTFLGWVPRILCKPFDREAVLASYNHSLRNPSKESSPDMGNSQPSRDRPTVATINRRILKFALQYHPCANAEGAGRRMVQQISLQFIGDRLLDLEADLPTHLLGNASFVNWMEWRRRVSRCENTMGLASECLMLGYQLERNALKKGVASSLRPTLDAFLGTGRSCCEPTIISVDKGVTLLIESIDWEKVMRGMNGELSSINPISPKPDLDDQCDGKGATCSFELKSSTRGKRKEHRESTEEGVYVTSNT